MKKVIMLILVSSFVLSAISCTDTPEKDKDTDASATSFEPETVELIRENTPDSLPDNLDFDGAKISIMFPESHGGSADQIDWVFEDDGDIVSSAIYNRQREVEERLNVKFEINNNYKVIAWKDVLKNSVLAGDGSFDIVYGPQADTDMLITENIYLDLADAKYIDYDQPWWNNDFMDEITIGGKRYLLAGDISLSMLSYMSCIYFNKEQFGKISGETPDDLYKTVLDGNWTMDKLAEYCRMSYRDLNGDSTFDDADQYGMGAVTASTTDHMTFNAGIRFTTRDKDDIPNLTLNNEKTVEYAEKLYDLYYQNEGIRMFPPEQDSLRVKIPNKLINGEVTFMCGYFYSASMLRDMKTDYGIIPYPKLDETTDGYRSLVHDSAMLVSVPISCDKIDTVSAVIEAIASENYRTVTPAYYEVALKTKYIRDDVSGQIIDMIHASGTTDFAYVYGYSMNNIGTIMRTLMTKQTSDFASTYASVEAAAKKGLDNLISAFKE